MRLRKSKRSKKSIRSRKSTRANRLARLKNYTHLTREIGVGTIALVTICVFAGAMSIAVYQSSPPAHIASVNTQPEKAATPAGAKKASSSTAMAATAVASKTAAPDETVANAPAAEPAATAPGPKSAPVTITGCLERADETFRLKDTTGVDAPKSRSWKSAFLKKGAASIEVVDAANRLKLPDHVGQRVSVTGTLVEREMQVRSLQRVAASCTDAARVRI